MKNALYTAFIFIFCSVSVQAQKPITLTSDTVKIGNTRFPGFWLGIPEVKHEKVRENWSKTILKGTKSKILTVNNEMTLFGAIIPEVYDGNVNIMSKIDDRDSITMLFVCFETTRDNFIVKSSEQYEKLSKYLKKFAREQYLTVAKEQLSVEEDKLDNLEKELKSVRRDKEKMEKDIQISQVRITQENDNTSSLKKELEVIDSDIDYKSSQLSTMENGDVKKEKQSELKDIQKKKKGLLKDINSCENRISKEETSISDNKRNIELNSLTQTELLEKIKQQSISIEKHQQKVKNIVSF